MHEIKCPKCGEVFKVDESSYAEILNQVKSNEFNEEVEAKIHERLEKQKMENEMNTLKSQKRFDAEKEELLRKINAYENELKNNNDKFKNEKELALLKKDNEITSLKEQLNTQKEFSRNENQKALFEKEQEINKLKQEVEAEKNKGLQAINEQRNQFSKQLEDKDTLLKEKDDQIAYLKDFKTKLSTKMIGESLEQYCLTEFNKARMNGYQRAYFEKDNDVVDGQKGDFVFRDYTEEKVELLSIMFEMKNQNDETATKHKNEDFFKKLDEDRKKKNCEYAVLVSTLESDNDYYNSGIVDVSYRYPKMYVVRPQCFLAIIGILKNLALSMAEEKRLVVEYKERHVDITNFELQLEDFKKTFNYNAEQLSKHFDKTIEQMDKAIKDLQNARDNLEATKRNLTIANNKAQDVTIKRLTKNSPSIYEEYKSSKKE